MICDFVGDHTARLRSYELLARRPAQKARRLPRRCGWS